MECVEYNIILKCWGGFLLVVLYCWGVSAGRWGVSKSVTVSEATVYVNGGLHNKIVSHYLRP